MDQRIDGSLQHKKNGMQTLIRMGLYDWLQCIVSAVVAGILIFVFVAVTSCKPVYDAHPRTVRRVLRTVLHTKI